MITWENYEEYIMMHADGELPPEQEQALIAFINEHPELKSELAAYSSAHITPDEDIVYPDKQQLLRPQSVKRVLAFPHWQRYSIAAGIAALVCISVFKWGAQQGNDISSPTASVSDSHPQQAAPPAPATMPVVNTNTVTVSSSANVAQVADTQANTISPKQNGVNNKRSYTGTIAKNISEKAADNNNNRYAARQAAKVEMEEVTVAVQKIPVKPAATETPSLIEVPEYEIVTEKQDHKRSFFDRLPLDEANRNQLKTITHIASDAVQGVSNARQELDDKAITVSIKNNNIHISL